MSVSADSYPSRSAVERDGGSGNFDKFMANNVHPAYAEAGPSGGDDAPPREYAGPGIDHLVASRGAPRPVSSVAGEVHGALHRPVTTLRHDSAALGENGFPSGWRQAANPNSGSAVS